MSLQMMQLSRERFKRFLQKRFSLRLHMFLILSGVSCSGVLCSKLLLEMHVRSMLIRYPLAVVFSYLVFFGLMKFWLIYLAASSGRRSSLVEGDSRSGDILSGLPFDLPGGDSGGPSFSSGGGSFGGGGTSASFDGPAVQAFAVQPPDSGGGSGKDVAEGAGEAVSGILDADDAGWVLIVLCIVIAIICGAGVYLIYQAPVILSDAAFQVVLSTSLIKRMKKMAEPDWMGSVLRATAVPFMVVLMSATVAAWAAHRAYPQAAKMSEVVRHILH